MEENSSEREVPGDGKAQRTEGAEPVDDVLRKGQERSDAISEREGRPEGRKSKQ